MRAKVSSELIENIFWKNTPLHDGAVIIKDDKILAARCIMPVSDRQDIPGSMGLRHRAALGISSVSDAYVVVVSEETGNITFFKDGNYKVRVSPEELKRLERLTPDPRSPRLQHTLDAFLFCCYAGLRYSDFTSLSDRNIVNIGRERWLVYRSVKTQAEVRLPLSLLFEGKCLAILDKYATCPADFFRLSDNSNVNKRLRILGRMAGLEKPFSFHAARHTNATLLIYKGVNITTVQKLLGHKNVRTTQIYANVSDRTIVHDLKSHSR